MHFGLISNEFLKLSLGRLRPCSPLCLPEDALVPEALRLLREHRVGCVLVLDQEGCLKGIFTERDAVLRLELAACDFANVKLSEVMTAPVQTVEATTPVAFALNMMSQGGYRHLPLVDDENRPIGVLSVKDIVDYLVSSFTQGISAVY